MVGLDLGSGQVQVVTGTVDAEDGSYIFDQLARSGTGAGVGFRICMRLVLLWI